MEGTGAELYHGRIQEGCEGSDGRLQPIEPYYHLISALPDYYRTEINKLVAAGKLAGKSGEGENLVLDMPESAVRVMIILNRQQKE